MEYEAAIKKNGEDLNELIGRDFHGILFKKKGKRVSIVLLPFTLERGDTIHVSVHLCNKKYRMIDEKQIGYLQAVLGTMWKEGGMVT